MEKNRIRPVKVGNGVRMSYAHQGEVLEMPNLIEVQTNSYQWFLDDGLKEVFRDISPISDFGGHLSLEFVDFKLCRDESKYDIDQCTHRKALLCIYAPCPALRPRNSGRYQAISRREIRGMRRGSR